jgi:predicted tellurium resistance membrane protein TerC
MRLAFGFFLRLFLCFVGAKLVLRGFAVPGRDYLLALTVVLLINVYLFQYLVFRDRKPASTAPAAAAPAQKPEDPPPAKDS